MKTTTDTPTPSLPLVRAMTKILIDNEIDPYDRVAVITVLINAGFTGKQIDINCNAARAMTSIRLGHNVGE